MVILNPPNELKYVKIVAINQYIFFASFYS